MMIASFRYLRLAGLAAFLIFAPIQAVRVAAADEDGFRSIFNGRDLAGWDADPTFWSVQDGAITGECTPEKQPSHNTFCIWKDGEVDDFELTAKFKLLGGNSGIQFRSKVADSGWNEPRIGHNAGGGPLIVGDRAIEDGIGVHARSVLVYDLPAGAKRFTAKGGVDKGGTDQNNGLSTSVRFLVAIEK